MSSLLSVIVPVYKVEKFLRKTIDSILNQTLNNIEIILVDDCSPDNSPAICDEYASCCKNVKVVHKPVNEGLGMACNTGLLHASGQYVAFCDSDDWVDSKMYEKMLSTALELDADAIYTGLKRVDDNGNILSYMSHPTEFHEYNGKQQLQNLILDMIGANPSARETRCIQVSAKVVLYKKSVIDRNELKFVSEKSISSEDQCFNISFLLESKIVCVLPEYFYNYRSNPNSITLNIREDLFDKIKALYNYIENLCIKNDVHGYQFRLQRMLIDYSRNHIYNICKSSLSYTHKKDLVEKICKDSIWKRVWSTYPVRKSWWKHKIFSYAMKSKCFLFMYMLTK